MKENPGARISLEYASWRKFLEQEKTLFLTSTFAEIANACYQCWIPQTDLNHVWFLSPTARDTRYPLIADNLNFVQTDKIGEVEHE